MNIFSNLFLDRKKGRENSQREREREREGGARAMN